MSTATAALIAAVSDPLVTAGVRMVLTAPFWCSGFCKLMRFSDAVEEMRQVGLGLPRTAAALTILTQLTGSALVVSGHLVWLGAALLAGFTAAASALAHPFWKLSPPLRAHAFNACLANLGLIGGLGLAAILAME